MEMLINVYARFIHKQTEEPVHGKNFKARLYDKDVIKDDFLGETTMDKEGIAHFKIESSMYRSEDSPFETHPDFYLIVLHDEVIIFKTPVAPNIDFKKEGNFDSTEGEQIDLGTFLI